MQEDRLMQKQALHLYVHERGATLIVVLLVLVVISVLGTMAVRQSSIDLSIATASQVDKVLFSAADAGYAKFELDAQRTDGKTKAIDYIVNAASDKTGKEVVFCMRPRQSQFLDITKVTEKTVDGTATLEDKGYCEPARSEDYVAARQVNMTQITMKKADLSAINGEVLGLEFRLTSNPGVAGANPDRKQPCPGCVMDAIDTTTTSVMPSFIDKTKHGALGATGTTTISGCMKQLAKAKGTVTSTSQCLQELGAPYQTHDQLYEYRSEDMPGLAR